MPQPTESTRAYAALLDVVIIKYDGTAGWYELRPLSMQRFGSAGYLSPSEARLINNTRTWVLSSQKYQTWRAEIRAVYLAARVDLRGQHVAHTSHHGKI